MGSKLVWYMCVSSMVIFLSLPALIELLGQRDVTLWKEHTPTIMVQDAARMLLDGDKKIIFVDIREWDEYNEFHIPSAVHIPLYKLRDVNPAIFEGADAVVPYCLKDFRGFEGAKILKEIGVKNVHLLDGFGFNKWKEELNVVAGKFNGKNDEQAIEDLKEFMAEDK